jgi:hypothetical protein
MTGTIPSCVWSSATLRLFHASGESANRGYYIEQYSSRLLAGNGLTGTLGEIANIQSSKLSDINLANNNLVGTIPLSLQTNSIITQIGGHYEQIAIDFLTSYRMHYRARQ